MPASSEQILKWKDMIEKTLDIMEREKVNVNEYLDELQNKYTVDEKYDNDNNNNNKQISLLVNINSTHLCDKGHDMSWMGKIEGKCIGCGISSKNSKKCESCIQYDERYNIKNFDKTGNKYIWCQKCQTETNKENIKNEIEKNNLLIAQVTKILNENPQINIDLLTKLKGKTSLEYMLNEICIDQNIFRYSLYTFDIDGFKKLNEDLGHDGADNILKQIGNILNDMEKKSKREWHKEKIFMDRLFAFRQGGDEFSIITDRGPSQVYKQERLYLYLKNEINKLGITVSVGMCCVGLNVFRVDPIGLDKTSKWFEYADKYALYAAKKNGKNTIRIWDNKQKKIVSGYRDFK